MEKRGQVSIFMLIGIIILVLIGLFIYFSGYSQKPTIQIPEKTESITEVENIRALPPNIREFKEFKEFREEIKESIENSGYMGLYWIGKKGGYFDLPEKVTSFNIPYFKLKNKTYLPSVKDLEEQMRLHVLQELSMYDDSKEGSDYNFKREILDVAVRILDNKIIIKVIHPIMIDFMGQKFLLTEQETKEIPIRLKGIYNLAKTIVKESDEGICLTCGLDTIKEGMNINLMPFTDENKTGYLISIIDQKSLMAETIPYEFNFAMD